MKNNSSLDGWFSYLRKLHPIRGLVHVGAGTGLAINRYSDWQIGKALLIEADVGLYRKLATTVRGYKGWIAAQALISAVSSEQIFYVATNPNESGALDPERLNFLWRNLRVREKRKLEAITLDKFLTIADNDIRSYVSWLVIDCLPAMLVLDGGEQCLRSCDIVIARVLLMEEALLGVGATKNEVDERLERLGFRCVVCEPERQHAVGTAIYVRDWQQEAQRLQRAFTEGQVKNSELNNQVVEQKRLNSDQRASIEELQKVMQVACEKQGEIEKLRHALEVQLTRIAQLENERAEMDARQHLLDIEVAKSEARITELRAQEQLNLEHQRRIETLQLEAISYSQKIQNLNERIDDAAHNAAALEARLEKISGENSRLQTMSTDQQTLIEELQKVSQVSREKQEELEKLRRVSEAQVTRIAQLENERTELDARQQLLDIEIVKAETQIEFIKDVVLREKAF